LKVGIERVEVLQIHRVRREAEIVVVSSHEINENVISFRGCESKIWMKCNGKNTTASRWHEGHCEFASLSILQVAQLE